MHLFIILDIYYNLLINKKCHEIEVRNMEVFIVILQFNKT